MIGWNIDDENIPIPPMIDRPKAPVLGIASATYPNILGQK